MKGRFPFVTGERRARARASGVDDARKAADKSRATGGLLSAESMRFQTLNFQLNLS
jgi:hypothetical protein